MVDYKRKAIGLMEVDDLVTCFVAMDAAAKTANVTIQNIERNRYDSNACFKIRGDVSDVEQANQVGRVIAHTVIASPAEESEPVFYMTVSD